MEAGVFRELILPNIVGSVCVNHVSEVWIFIVFDLHE